MKFYIQLVVLVCAFSIIAETRIKGDLTGMNLDESGNPFIVEQDIIVPNGQKVVIKEGCIFLFNPFSGLQVLGELKVAGSQEKPVVFTSIYDNTYNKESPQLPNPFDWNGILVARESGNVNFTNFELEYSVYGIKSQNPGIKIQNGIFKQNGQFHFTLMDKIQFVQDNISYSFNQQDVDPGTGDAPGKGKNVPKGDTKANGNGVKAFRFTSLGIGAAGLLVGAIFGAQIPGDINDMETQDSEEWHAADAKKNRDIIASSIGGGVFVLGMACFAISFAF
ncbi:MAG TPA: hypothetical protein VHO70_11010 [Chitinispirillaceae bacterium]|nr:hypothetical protein [Chitinispirillaceae bacterium]